MKEKLKVLKNKIDWPIIIIIAAVSPFYFIFGCPIRFFTGISCMGCGMSRAATALLHFDFETALHMHPLIFIMPIVVVIFLIRKRLPKKIANVLLFCFIALMLIVYIYRLCTGSDIVYIRPAEGFFYTIFQSILNLSGGI